MPLRIAAKVPRGETGYFEKHIQPEIDGTRVELVGEVDNAASSTFLSAAAACCFQSSGRSRSAL